MDILQVYRRNGCHADSQMEKEINEQELLFM